MPKKVKLGIGAGPRVLRFSDFSCGGRALLLKLFQRFQITLGGIAVGSGFHQLRFQVQHFFLASTPFGCTQIGLRAFYLCLGASGLGASVGIIQNKEQFAFLDGVALFDINVPHTCRYRSMGLEVVDGLDFPVSRNQAADCALLDDGGPHLYRVVAVSDKSRQDYHRSENCERRYPPTPRLTFRTVSIQGHAEKSTSFNVSSGRDGKQPNEAWDLPV